MGFNGTDGALRWVRTLPGEVIGGDATAGGFAFCDAQGNILLTDARAGGDAGHVSFGQPVEGCVVSGGSFHGTAAAEDSGTLTEQISTAINLPDTEMATIQRFLLRELGTNDDPTITKTLLDLASDARTQPEILAEARSQLASRRNGVEYMVEALGRHYDFLSGVLRGPPVGPLADALAAVGEKRAAPLLAAHLNDPSDTPNDVRHCAHALVALATPQELPAVQSFFSLYHATADDEDLVAAVIDAARVLVQVGGPDGGTRVRDAAADPLTNSAVREGIANLAPDNGRQRSAEGLKPAGRDGLGAAVVDLHGVAELSFLGRLWLAFLMFFRIAFDPAVARRAQALNDRTQAPRPTSSRGESRRARRCPAALPERSTDAELGRPTTARSRLLALFQREGRLVDFLGAGHRDVPRRGDRRRRARGSRRLPEARSSPTWTSSACATKPRARRSPCRKGSTSRA